MPACADVSSEFAAIICDELVSSSDDDASDCALRAIADMLPCRSSMSRLKPSPSWPTASLPDTGTRCVRSPSRHRAHAAEDRVDLLLQLLLDLLLRGGVPLVGVAAGLDLVGHLVQLARELADLVLAVVGAARVEVALADAADVLQHRAHRLHDRAADRASPRPGPAARARSTRPRFRPMRSRSPRRSPCRPRRRGACCSRPAR